MEKDFVNAIKFYYITSKLKDLTRSGPLVWKVKREIKDKRAKRVIMSENAGKNIILFHDIWTRGSKYLLTMYDFLCIIQ